MEGLKFNLHVKEILNQVSDAKYHNLIKAKIKFLENGFKEPVKIILVKNNSASEIEKILNAGKVEWKKPETEFPRTPIAIKVDALNLTEIEFLAVLLHECGHINDYNNDSIQIKSKESEISAWRHAIKDFNSINSLKEDKQKFIKIVEKSLFSYNIIRKEIEKLIMLIV